MKILNKINPIVIIIFTFIIIFVTQIIYFSVKDNNQIELLTSKVESYKQNELVLENNIRLLTDTANEVRVMLSLPEIDLTFVEKASDEIISEEKNENLPFYNAVDYIKGYSSKIEMENELNFILNKSSLNNYFIKNNLTIKKTGPSNYELLKNSNLFFSIKAENPLDPYIYIEDLKGDKHNYSLKNIKNDSTELLKYLNSAISVLNEHYSKYNLLKKQFVKLIENETFLKFLKSENLEIENLKSTTTKIFYSIHNKDNSYSINIYLDSINLVFEVDNNKYSTFSNFYTSLNNFLLKSDKRTKEIKVVDTAKFRIESILVEDSFLSFLNQNNLSIGMLPREDNDYFYYDIFEGKDTLLGSFAIQKIIGDIYLMDPEDIMISSLKYLENPVDISNTIESNLDIPDNLPVILDKYSNSSSTTFVVIGSHENNADTIILVHADGISKNITLIAIPRDLYYQDNKINDYYRTYGGDKFIEVLSDITGLSIEGYIAVDMYAFIDLINILGGIDITLQADLIDPTYMVRDNGEWSTLYYTKGNHHLNGIESLRITRSRHTSSDFGRTSRQQLVLQGIKDKMGALDITDLGTILELFTTLKKYLDTNFSSMEMLSLFVKYKDATLNRKQGLSTFNVLYNTYTNIYKLKDKSKQYEEGFYRGYWILLPRKDDWNVIKWYIRTLIEGTEI